MTHAESRPARPLRNFRLPPPLRRLPLFVALIAGAARGGEMVVHRLPDHEGTAHLSYYNTSPESPDGTRLAYVRSDTVLKDRHDRQPATLWVSDLNGGNARKVADITSIHNHNGAYAQWVDDTHIAFHMEKDRIQVVDIETGAMLEETLPGKIGHKPHDGRILGTTSETESGVYELREYDIAAGTARTVASVLDLRDVLPDPPPDWYLPPEDWSLAHAEYSADGSLIGIRVSVASKQAAKDAGVYQEQRNLIVTMKPDGSDMVLFGPQPMHYFWYDASTIAGHDNQIDDGRSNNRSMRRWSRRTEFIETVAGPGNHGALSPDRLWAATDTWYGSEPRLLIYRTDTGESTELFRSPDKRIVWDRAIHLNPSFGRDGRRVYFNHPLSKDQSTIAWVELPEREDLKSPLP